jgi:hypothetical protein
MRAFRLWAPRNFPKAAVLTLVTAAVVLPIMVLTVAQSPVRAQSIPSDAQGGCPIPAATFNPWFDLGHPTLNGVVKPADSLNFPNIPNCSFYQWSEQMFLWLTSPAPSIYGGGSHIFDSPTFYDVSPLDGSGHRTLKKHVSGIFPFTVLRANKPGPHGLPVLMVKGRLLEVEPTKISPNGKQMILNSLGKEVEVESAEIKNGKAVFTSPAGKPILRPKPIMRAQIKAIQAKTPAKPMFVQRFIINGRPIFIFPSGDLVPPEEGQATGDVLESQQNSLVYYFSMVNDVYAYFLTGNKDHAFTATQFPTTPADLANITTFASAHGVTFPDPNALAIEIKTAWVETTGLPNASSYITMSANVPVYNKSNPNQWVPTGATKSVTLAMVSMHVVGSTKGHPEMIWASFEHFGNTPSAAYTYTSTTGPKTVPQNTSGTWLFSASGSAGPFNVSHMNMSGNDIVSIPPATISPSNTLRTMPFGIAGSNAFSNTQIISSNHSVLSQLTAGDIRANYFMLGATWTPGGVPPTGGNGVGTNVLANTTLETYIQGTNCFLCHQGNMLGSGPDSGLSHIYFPIQPLF